ncbi:MAG: type II toxin-antitoxin system prevent-host-death family antitoxin [Microthrixaceae bacterium]|nr:type II toxin-antitoxin system prevent-host-death family antitoxin [Microthrixaceae bacterium]
MGSNPTPGTIEPVRQPVIEQSGGDLYISEGHVMYTLGMDVAVSELRAHLARWIDAAREGNDIVITDRGTPVARIVALDSKPVIDQLTAEGVISRPTRPTRPVAGDRQRPTPKRPVADIVSEQRR